MTTVLSFSTGSCSFLCLIKTIHRHIYVVTHIASAVKNTRCIGFLSVTNCQILNTLLFIVFL